MRWAVAVSVVVVLVLIAIVGIIHPFRTPFAISSPQSDVRSSAVRAPVDADTLSKAALSRLYPIIGGRFSGVDVTRGLIDRQRHDIACLRGWTMATITDAGTRDAYLNWLDYYEREASDQQARLEEGPLPTVRQSTWERERDEKQARVDAVAKTLPRPPLPCPIVGEKK